MLCRAESTTFYTYTQAPTKKTKVWNERLLCMSKAKRCHSGLILSPLSRIHPPLPVYPLIWVIGRMYLDDCQDVSSGELLLTINIITSWNACGCWHQHLHSCLLACLPPTLPLSVCKPYLHQNADHPSLLPFKLPWSLPVTIQVSILCFGGRLCLCHWVQMHVCCVAGRLWSISRWREEIMAAQPGI